MLTLCSVQIKNFVCFEDITVEPSVDPEKPLTVIRAENGSGKTTFLRAVRWGMYGEKGLPKPSSSFSVHPVWWNPENPPIETTVSIEFETDGSSRNFEPTDAAPSRYLLHRTVRTIGKPAAGDNKPDFHRVEEKSTLIKQAYSGQWDEHVKSPDAVVEELLPWKLRDFFVMDADKVADFVGGSENKLISRQEYQQKTTDAINSLLGLEVFKKARNRVEGIAKEFGSQATKAIGDHDLNELQTQLNRHVDEKDQIETIIRDLENKETDLDDKIERLNSDYEEEIGRLGVCNSLKERRKKNREEHKQRISERNTFVTELADDLESPNLLACFASAAIISTRSFLEPLHEQGSIPDTHLPFVRNLLLQGRCVCGQDLSEEGEYRRCVTQRVADAEEGAPQANYLYKLYEATTSLHGLAENSVWKDNNARHKANLARCDNRISDLVTEQKEIDIQLDNINEEKIQTVKEEIKAHRTQLQKVRQDLALRKGTRDQLKEKIEPLRKTIDQRKRNERAATDHRNAEEMAQYVVEVLDAAYATIEQDQVTALSKQTNQLFHRMAANVSDVDFDEVHYNKTNLRMIAEIGVRPVEGRHGSVEIYALNGRGRAMPPVEINGASRRVLALSFVLALCDESNTQAPLIADSLLNFMSGRVRHNTLRVTSEYSRQPILLLTTSDLKASSEVEVVEKYAGSTYTLTGQWDALDTGEGGDVVNLTQNKQVSLLCSCGPRQYCDICERTGQAETPGWAKRL